MGFLLPIGRRNDKYLYVISKEPACPVGRSSTELSHGYFRMLSLCMGFLLPIGRRNDKYLYVISKEPACPVDRIVAMTNNRLYNCLKFH